MSKRGNVWVGIYPTLQEAAAHARQLQQSRRVSRDSRLHSFEQERWVQHQIKEAEQLQQGDYRPRASRGILKEVLAGYVAGRKKGPSVLDFGGGLALEFLRLKGAHYPAHRMRFCVIETPTICRTGRAFFRASPNVTFRSTLPQKGSRVDVFHAANSLHYVKNWKGFLKRVSRLQPELLVLAGITAGQIPTFATLQSYYGNWLPVWFWHQKEFMSFVEELGYECVLCGEAEARYFGRVRDLPMSNFPRTHRLPRKCDLVFRRRIGRIK